MKKENAGSAHQEVSPFLVVVGDLFGQNFAVDDADADFDAATVPVRQGDAAQNRRVVIRRNVACENEMSLCCCPDDSGNLHD